jgi:Zinc carboxypeptidase
VPPAPPDRPNVDAYHFHTYDFTGSAANPPWVASPPVAARGNYRFYSMVRDLNNLLAVGQARQVPNITLTNVGGQTARHRNTMMLSFGNRANAAARRTVVITGGIHAREWVATEIAYLIAEYLIVNYPDPAVIGPLSPSQQQLKRLVDSRSIRIIPMVNPDGNRRSVFGTGANDRLWRKNRRRLPALGQKWIQKLRPGGAGTPPTAPFQNVGYWTQPVSLWAQYDVPDYDPTNGVPAGAVPGVLAGVPNYRNHKLTNLDIGVDLNRNMPTPGWGYDCGRLVNGVLQYSNWDPADDVFFGTGPGIEPETSNVRQAMITAAAGGLGGNLSVSIDYHCYAKEILYPSETHFANGVGALYTSTGQMMQALIRNQHGAGVYGLGTPLAQIGYNATGSVADYAALQHQARAFTIELDPGILHPTGFQLPEGSIQDVFEKNIRGALAAIAAPGNAHQAAQYQNQFANWNVFGSGNHLP